MPTTGTYVGGHRHRQGWKRQSTEKGLKMTHSSWTLPLNEPMKIKTKNIPKWPTLTDLLVMGAGECTGEARGPNPADALLWDLHLLTFVFLAGRVSARQTLLTRS